MGIKLLWDLFGAHQFTKFVTKITLILFMLPAIANAVVIYDESIQGDAPNLFLDSTRPQLDLSIGNNTLLGSSNWLVLVENPDFDHYSLSVPEGSVLSSIAFSYVLGTGLESSNNWSISSNDPSNDSFQGIGIQVIYQNTTSPTNLFVDTGILPLSSNSSGYNFGLSGWSGRAGSQGNNIFVDYQLDFNVVSVPEPFTSFLLAGGLIGIGLTRGNKMFVR